jgi:hypothetical protein
MASRARPDGKQRLPTDSGGPALWPCRARRIGAFPKPMKEIIRSNPERGSSITYLAALPVALSERRCLRVPTGSHITIAAHLASKDHRQPHLLSTRCRNAPSVPAPSAPQGQGSDRWSGATRDRLRIAATPRLLRSSLAIATSLPALGRVPSPWGCLGFESTRPRSFEQTSDLIRLKSKLPKASVAQVRRPASSCAAERFIADAYIPTHVLPVPSPPPARFCWRHAAITRLCILASWRAGCIPFPVHHLPWIL